MVNNKKHVFLTALFLSLLPLLLSALWLETTIGVGDGPCALVYNPTYNKVYCANYGSDNVTVIDATTNEVITTITVGVSPDGLTLNPDNKVHCANYGSDNVTVIRDVTGKEKEEIYLKGKRDGEIAGGIESGMACGCISGCFLGPFGCLLVPMVRTRPYDNMMKDIEHKSEVYKDGFRDGFKKKKKSQFLNGVGFGTVVFTAGILVLLYSMHTDPRMN